MVQCRSGPGATTPPTRRGVRGTTSSGLTAAISSAPGTATSAGAASPAAQGARHRPGDDHARRALRRGHGAAGPPGRRGLGGPVAAGAARSASNGRNQRSRARPNPEVECFVAAAEGYLWSEQGRPMQRWLAERGPLPHPPGPQRPSTPDSRRAIPGDGLLKSSANYDVDPADPGGREGAPLAHNSRP